MPKDFIRVDTSLTTAKFASDLVAFKEAVRDVLQRGAKIKGIMDRNYQGNDYAACEGLFGLPQNQGATVYGLIGGVLRALHGAAQNADAMTLIDRVG